jgi:Domain of unknown function (DUF6268)
MLYHFSMTSPTGPANDFVPSSQIGWPRSVFFFLFIIWGLTVASASMAVAQKTDSTKTANAPTDDLNFDEFGDADTKTTRTFATQKVLYITPTRLISVGYESQFGAALSSMGFNAGLPFSAAKPLGNTVSSPVNSYRGLRLAVNTPVVSRSNFILNLGLTYWNTAVQVANPEQSVQFAALNQGLRSTGINATVFKPFDNRHFLIVQANADLNGTYQNFGDLSQKNLTVSGLAVYGWKRDDNFMWGLGLTRTYRGGNLLHIPVLLYNRTFNPKWGIEAVFPARAAIRRNFGTTSLLSVGYELEGNVFYLGNQFGGGVGRANTDLYLRRSEIKPRINYERKLTGFVWLGIQAGMSLNWRYDAFASQNPTSDEGAVFTNKLGNAPYLNVSINLVSP